MRRVVAQLERLIGRNGRRLQQRRPSPRAGPRRRPTSCRGRRAVPLPHFTSAPAMRGVPSGSFDRSSSTTGSAVGLSLPMHADVHLAPFDVLLDQHRRIEVGVQPVDALHQLADRRHHGVELDADRAVLARRLDDHRELEVVREVEAAAVRAGEHRRVDAVELEDLLRDRLVLRVEQAVRAGAGEPLVDQLEVGGDAVVGGVVAGERLGEVEDQIALHPRQRVQALERSVEHVQRRLVPELAERVGDFVLDFLLVERARQRRLVRGAAAALPALPSDRRGRRCSVCPQLWRDYKRERHARSLSCRVLASRCSRHRSCRSAAFRLDVVRR